MNFITPTPQMATSIKRDHYGLMAHVTITGPEGLQARTTMRRDIKATDEPIERLKRHLAHSSIVKK